MGLGLLWDVVDAAAYFCSQRRARTRRLPVTAPADLRCPARDAGNYRCVRKVGHAEQHTGAAHVWVPVDWDRAVREVKRLCAMADIAYGPRRGERLNDVNRSAARHLGCTVAPSCSYPKCLEG